MQLPIGVFDSGVGGLTVLRALRAALPGEQFVYLGDTARLPYGTKSGETVTRYAEQAARVLVARGIISDGGTLSQGFDHCGLATPIALRMLRVGERSGQLGAMLTRSALFYEGESARWIERFTKVFEPALMTAIGLLVGLIVVLLYLPIFDLAGALQ